MKGSQKIMHYLSVHGYRSIGFIGNVSFSPSYMERYIGYRMSSESSSALKTPNQFQITNVREDHPSELFKVLDTLQTMPDCWFTVNNGYASMLVTYLQGRGFAVPGDIGVMAFDNTDIAQMMTPMLTVIATDLNAMADEAWGQLSHILGKSLTKQVYVRIMPTIIERESIRHL